MQRESNGFFIPFPQAQRPTSASAALAAARLEKLDAVDAALEPELFGERALVLTDAEVKVP